MERVNEAPRIPVTEFKERRSHFAKSCEEAGLAGALVISRNEPICERAGYNVYLGNYQANTWSGLDDCAPDWECRFHSAVVVPARGESTLIHDSLVGYALGNEPSFDKEVVSKSIENIKFAYNIPRAIVEALKEHGLGKGRVGVVGSHILPMKHFLEIQRALSEVEWVLVDDILIDQMNIKSEAEWKIIRYVCEAVSDVTDKVFEAAKPGMSEWELNNQVRLGLLERGCELGWMRPNGPRRMEPGRLYAIGLCGWCRGYIFDISRSRMVVGSKPNPKQAYLLDMLNEWAMRHLEELKPGRTVGEVAEFGYRYFIDEKKEITLEEFEAGVFGAYCAFGHGLGLTWSKPWVRRGQKDVLKPNMYIAMEVVYTKPGTGHAEIEYGVEITDKGPRLLTRI
jgi:Xaa-Pro aminopeptidase